MAASVAETVDMICNILLLMLTVASVICAFLVYRHHKERTMKESACSLAQYYEQNILISYEYITRVLVFSGLEGVFKYIFKYNGLKDFDSHELMGMLQEWDTTAEEFDRKIQDYVRPEYISRARVLSCRAKCGDSMDDERSGELMVLDFLREISVFLNDLEWFAMSCQYGLADEELLYQSLHQSYISSCWLLYYFISYRNTCNEDKYYTNIIWLFNKWKDRLTFIQKQGNEIRKEAILEAEKLTEAAKEAREKAEKAGSEVFSGKPLR